MWVERFDCVLGNSKFWSGPNWTTWNMFDCYRVKIAVRVGGSVGLARHHGGQFLPRYEYRASVELCTASPLDCFRQVRICQLGQQPNSPGNTYLLPCLVDDYASQITLREIGAKASPSIRFVFCPGSYGSVQLFPPAKRWIPPKTPLWFIGLSGGSISPRFVRNQAVWAAARAVSSVQKPSGASDSTVIA
jgi:hypothetical protein